MKYLVETTGNFILTDIIGRQVVEAYRPCVVTKTAFIDSHRGDKLNVIETLADEADDKTLAEAKDIDAAIAALPRIKAKADPLDHDGDGRKGGTKPKAK